MATSDKNHDDLVQTPVESLSGHHGSDFEAKAFEIAEKYFYCGRPLYPQDDIERAIATALREASEQAYKAGYEFAGLMGHHPSSDPRSESRACFEAKAQELLDWNLSGGVIGLDKFTVTEDDLNALRAAIVTVLREAYGSGLVQEPSGPDELRCDHLVSEIFHKEQLVIWSGEFIDALLGHIKDPNDYEDVLDLHRRIEDFLTGTIANAVAHALQRQTEEPPTCGDTGSPLAREKPDTRMDWDRDATSKFAKLSAEIASLKCDYSNLKVRETNHINEIERLREALRSLADMVADDEMDGSLDRAAVEVPLGLLRCARAALSPSHEADIPTDPHHGGKVWDGTRMPQEAATSMLDKEAIIPHPKGHTPL